MAATERTTYFNLPLFRPTDYTDWLDGGFNQAMNKIDSEFHTMDNRINQGSESIGGVTDQINTLATSVTNLSNEVQGLQALPGEFDTFKTQVEGDVTSVTSTAGEAKTTAEAAETAAEGAAAGVEAVKGSGWSENPYTLVQAKADVGALETEQAAADVKVTDLQGRVSDLEAGGGITENGYSFNITGVQGKYSQIGTTKFLSLNGRRYVLKVDWTNIGYYVNSQKELIYAITSLGSYAGDFGLAKYSQSSNEAVIDNMLFPVSFSADIYTNNNYIWEVMLSAYYDGSQNKTLFYLVSYCQSNNQKPDQRLENCYVYIHGLVMR